MFVPLRFPNIHNIISLFKHCLGNVDSLDSILMLKSLSPYYYIWDTCFFLGNNLIKKIIFSKCRSKGMVVESIYSSEYNWG
jgi:hypothetical protein